MNKRGLLIIVCLIFAASFVLPGSAPGQDAGFTVARFVTAEDVVDREPVGVSEAFPASIDSVYCFLEARNIAADTEIAMVWFYEGQETAMVTLLLKNSSRWRTFSSKAIAGRTGKWSVELRDASGNTLKTAEFTVQ